MRRSDSISFQIRSIDSKVFQIEKELKQFDLA